MTVSQKKSFFRRAIFPHLPRRYAVGPRGFTLIDGEAGLEEVDLKAALDHADALDAIGDEKGPPCARCGLFFDDDPAVGRDLAGLVICCRDSGMYEIEPYCAECWRGWNAHMSVGMQIP
jgi:hypothetical protein